jgi:hypothetical protein
MAPRSSIKPAGWAWRVSYRAHERAISIFAPRKAYRECLNRNFAFLLIHERVARSPAEDALLACRTEKMALAAFAEELMPVVKDRMKAWLKSGGHVPENLWWPAEGSALGRVPALGSVPAPPPAR